MNFREPIGRYNEMLSTKRHEIFGEFTRCLKSYRWQYFAIRTTNSVWIKSGCKKLENYFILVACTPTGSKSYIHRRQFLWLAENLPKVNVFWVVSALGLKENTHRSSIVNRSTKQLTLKMNLIEKLLRKSPRNINGGKDKRLRVALREYLIKPAKRFRCCLVLM